MITKKYLVVGNSVYVKECRYEHEAKITKIGRKYAYTDSLNVVIDMHTLRTKDTGHGYSSYAIYKSKAHYFEELKNDKYVRKVRDKIKDLPMSIGLAKRLNHELNLGIDYE